MIVRRYDRANGEEATPVTITQAAWAIARAIMEKPSRGDVQTIAEDLEAGHPNQTVGYRYVPDADPTPAAGERLTVKLTQAQVEQVQWALDPMMDFWCSESEAHARGGAVYDEWALPKLNGLTLELSPHDEINGDLCYRLEEQLPAMAQADGSMTAKNHARAGLNAAERIRKVHPNLGSWV